ncbi:MAG: TonB-dependent receptor [Bacteroidales bacterium]|nr:TonB-dependent receptor [Bacteroidales bacterium]
MIHSVFIKICFFLPAAALSVFWQPCVAQSQQKDISGTVFEKVFADDRETELPVYSMTVCLLQPGDSSIVKFTTSDAKGNFLLKGVAPGNYVVSISGLGYTTFYRNVTRNDFRRPAILLGRIPLVEAALSLTEVTITAAPPEVVVKEDTMEYNPVAFRMQESAVVEDLLKRLPGVEVEADGKVTVAGKEVKRIFVDGKEFFGNDPKMATKNITVDVVDKVQVIEKKSDVAMLTGVDDGEEETVINLTIKKGMKKGWIGNASAGGGTLADIRKDQSLRYSANGMISRFLESDQIALVFNSNNINNQGSTDQGNTVRSGMRGGGGSSGSGRGITNSNTLGLNAASVVSDKLKIGGNVRYNYSDELVNRNSFRTNLLVDSVSYRKYMSSEQNYSHNFAFDTKTEYKPDTLNTFSFSTRFSYNASNSIDTTAQTTLAGDIDSTRVNGSNAHTDVLSSGWTLGVELTWSRRFAVAGRRLNFTGRIDRNHSSGNGTNRSTSEFFLRPDRNKYLDQDLNTNSGNDAYNFRASYIEPVGGVNNTLQFSYNVRYNRTTNIKETFELDPLTGSHSILNHDYSKSLDNNFVNQTVGITFNAVRTKYSYTVGVNAAPSYTQSSSFIKNGEQSGRDSVLNRIKGRTVVNYSPQVNFRYRFNSNTNLRFDYRGSTRQPSVSQLDPTPNNTNPLILRTGNPNLLPSFSNNLSFRLNSSSRATQRSLSANAAFAFVMNEIINFTEYEQETGVQHTMPINENGSWNSSADVMYNSPLDKAKRLKFSAQTRVSYDNRIGYTTVNKQSERNISGTTGASQTVGLSYNKSWFYGQVRGSMRYSNTANSFEGKQDQKSYNYTLTYNMQLYLPQNLTLSSDINYRANRGLSTGYNKDEILWNASVGKQFLKKKQAGIYLRWNDVLQQRLNISRSVSANYIEDSEYNSLTSYFILSFTYRFNTMGGSRRRSYDSGGRDDGRDMNDFGGSPRDSQNRY